MSFRHTEKSSIHQKPIQDNFAKEKLIVEEKFIIKESTNSGLVLYSSTHFHQQKDSAKGSEITPKDLIVSSSCTKYSWSHLEGTSKNLGISLDQQCDGKQDQTKELVENSNKKENSSFGEEIECLSDDRLLKHLGCLNIQGQEKGSALDQTTDNSLTSTSNVTNNADIAESLNKERDNRDEVKIESNNSEEKKEDSAEKLNKESKFEASVRLKKLEERINNYTVNKPLPNPKIEQLSEKFSEIQKSPSIQLISSCSSVGNVHELNENAANTSGKSRVDSCIDFLSFSEKGEISLTPETSIGISFHDKENTSDTSSAVLCESNSCKTDEKHNELNQKQDHKIDQSNRHYITVSELETDCAEESFFREIKNDSLEKDEHNFLENKAHETYEKDKTVFQNIHALEGSPSDSEICRIFSKKETLDLKNLSNSEISERLSSEQETPINQVKSSPTRELTPSKLYTHCEFNARDFAILNHFLNNNNIHECYDELTEELVEQILNTSCETDGEKDCNANCEDSCDCSIEAIAIYNPIHTMRETTMGPIRGLLKKPNRPPTSRKNRVVFDETKNQFFDADYIILIREDCLYDEEEDTEPCTCGEHELVRICCDEGCCGYTDDGRTPPVSVV